MSTMKTAVSMDRELFERVDRAARRRGTTRSQYLARAAEALLERDEADQLTEQFNAVYGGPADPEEVSELDAILALHREVLTGDSQ